MLFSSVAFLYVFLPLVLILYYISPRKLKNSVLLIFSLLFYGWGEPIYIVLMLISILLGYVLGLIIAKMHNKGNKTGAKITLIVSVVLNLGALGFFKYTDFFIKNANAIFKSSLPILNIALPLGISFYTFQIMSYTIDVYRQDTPVQKNPLNLATYIALFPQLIAGPIVRYSTIEDQLSNRKECFDKFGEGTIRFVTGLGKKVLLANTAGEVFNKLSVLDSSENSVALSWLCAIAFTFQIYFDFSGYSDMAIGLGKMFGFDFLENFNYPYISKSITEFWRRWHISLSTWFRDYVYIPLGGSRVGKGKMIFNIFIVWFLTGFWHGAEWNFIAWGLYFFVLLIVEKFWLSKLFDKLPKWLWHIYALFFINLSWVIFAYDDIGKVFTSIKNMFFANGLPIWNQLTSYYYISYIVVFIIFAIMSTPILKKLIAFIGKKLPAKCLNVVGSGASIIYILGIMFMVTAYLASDSFNPFLYFRF